MYPNLYYFLKDAFHINPWPFTQYINSFGFFVAISFVIAAFVLSSELKRKEKQGLLLPLEENRLVGEPAKWQELLFNLLFGFGVGYKIIGAVSNPEQTNPQEYIFSAKGSWAGGLFLGLLFAGIKYYEKRQQALPVPEERKIRIWPHERVGDITIMAAIAGFIGAKLFDNLENWDRFIENPIANLLSPSGLTFYGGLICAAATILYFARRKKITWTHLVDSAAPALMLSYATGRIGCHVAGDGDWGIFNSAYMLDSAGKIVEAPAGQFKPMLLSNPNFTQYLMSEYGSMDAIPHAYFKGLSFLPNWFWAYNYPHNVNNIGSPIAGCEGAYCAQLTPLVFPTPLYEIIACLFLFGVLWSLRKRIKIPGRIFALYLMLNGIERFLVEKIRVNSTYSIFGFHPTQAELIATLLVIGGAMLWWWAGRNQWAVGSGR
jgi:phosphatidylglycerol:prolipoprotein diacylglycerol transferase